MNCADEQIDLLERTVTERVKLRAEYRFLKTVAGIGQILALTIMLETGEIKRFPTVGDFASYCRCVGSQKLMAADGRHGVGPGYLNKLTQPIEFPAERRIVPKLLLITADEGSHLVPSGQSRGRECRGANSLGFRAMHARLSPVRSICQLIHA